MTEKAKNLPDSEFETMVKSVLVEIEAKDKNLNEEQSRLFGHEVSLHRYQFDRQAQEAACLKAIKKEEWQKHFDALVNSQVCRADFRYNSVAHKEQEEQTEFKFPKEKKHESVQAFKENLVKFDDSIKQRYAARYNKAKL